MSGFKEVFQEILEYSDLATAAWTQFNDLKELRGRDKVSVDDLLDILQEEDKFNKLCIFLLGCYKSMKDFTKNYTYDLGKNLNSVFEKVVKGEYTVYDFMNDIRREVESMHDSMFEDERDNFGIQNAAALAAATPIPLGWVVGVPVVGVLSSARFRIKRNQLRDRKKTCLNQLDKHEERYKDHLKRSITI